MSFPNKIDDAIVLFYTPLGCYGTVSCTTGEVVDSICYFAICKYENDESFYLFGCNNAYETVSDSLWESAERCMRIAENSYGDVISWIVNT